MPESVKELRERVAAKRAALKEAERVRLAEQKEHDEESNIAALLAEEKTLDADLAYEEAATALLQGGAPPSSEGTELNPPPSTETTDEPNPPSTADFTGLNLGGNDETTDGE